MLTAADDTERNVRMNKKQSGQQNKGWRAVFALLLTVLLVTGVGVVISWRGIIGEMENHHIADVEFHTEVLYEELGRQFAVLDGYAASFTQEQLDDHTELLEKLQRCTRNTEFSLVCFVYPDGTLYRQDGAKAEVVHRFYFQKAMRGEYAIQFMTDNAIDPINRMGFAVPVVLGEEPAGVLLGLYDRGGFLSLFERTFSGEEHGHAYICDASGGLILGTEQAEEFLAEYGLRIENGSILSILNDAKFSVGSKLQMEEDIRSGRSGQAVYRYDGEKHYTAYMPLGVNDWYVISVLHERQVYEEALGVTGYLFSMVLLGMLAVIMIMIYLVLRMKNYAAQEQKKSEEIRYLFEHDPLTGILSERAFLERTETRIREGLEEVYCLVYLDIYKFKLINEMFGYQKGDELLRATAEEVQKFTERVGGLCCRISGDNFVLFIPHREELIRSFRTKNYRKNRIVSLDLYLHFGIYVIQDEEIPVDQMVDAARLAQKTVKGNYDNCIAYYTEAIKKNLLKEQEIITTMTKALEQKEFVVYLQPQYNYRTGAVCGAEALVRWLSPEKGLIPPGDFIPVFETNGFISHLDSYVWEQVCILQRKWLDAGNTMIPISVNVSRVDLMKGGLAQKMANLIRKYDLPAKMIRVEITESAYMDNPQLLIQEINALAAEGFLVEMDDFGSGYSSLNMLKDVPFHVLKTDLKFLTSSVLESRKNRILDNVIRMAHEMGMVVIAEGVETEEQAEALLKLNCECMQGYYFCRPVPVVEFEKLVFGS